MKSIVCDKYLAPNTLNHKNEKIYNMTALEKIPLLVGGSITICFGVWHFFVPTAFKWFSYIQNIPAELKNAIEAMNFFLSDMLVILGFETIYLTVIDSNNMKLMMVLMSLLWFARTIYQVVKPQGSMIPYMAEILTAVFSFTSICFILPLILRIINWK